MQILQQAGDAEGRLPSRPSLSSPATPLSQDHNVQVLSDQGLWVSRMKSKVSKRERTFFPGRPLSPLLFPSPYSFSFSHCFCSLRMPPSSVFLYLHERAPPFNLFVL